MELDEEDVYSTDDNDSVDLEPLACTQCCYKTQKKWLLDRHTASHLNDKPFKCSTCRFTHRDASVFVKHLVKHQPKTKFVQCCFCPFKAMPLMMKAHIQRHVPPVKIDCSECEYWTKSVNTMNHHIDVFHSRKHRCTMCSKILTKYSLAKHIKKAHKAQRSQRSASNGSMKKVVISQQSTKPCHARSKYFFPAVIPVVKLERCRVPPECWKFLDASCKPTEAKIWKSLRPKDYPSGTRTGDAERSLTSMVKVELPKSKEIRKPVYFPNLVSEFGDTLKTCKICDFQTRKEHLLKRHSDRHRNSVPFICQKCDFENISVYKFSNHMITHGNVKEDVYSCCFCDYWTHQKHNIPVHLERHRGAPQEFDCPECEEVLTSKSDLVTHFNKLHCKAREALNLHTRENTKKESDQPHHSNAECSTVRGSRVKATNSLRNSRNKMKTIARKKVHLNKLRSTRFSKTEHTNSKAGVVKKMESSKGKLKSLSGTRDKEHTKTIKKARELPIDRLRMAKSGKATNQYKPGPRSKKLTTSVFKEEEVLVEQAALERSPTSNKDNSPKHESGKSLNCKHCDYKTQIGLLMERHKEKHEAATFKCPECKYETLSSTELSGHYLYHFPSQTEFPCPYCSFISNDCKALSTHIECHRSVNFFDCSKCHFSGNNAGDTQRHHERMHLDKYSCTICNKIMTKHAIMKHLKKCHPIVYKNPAQSFEKHYMKYIKPVSVGTDKAINVEQVEKSTDKKDDSGSAGFANLNPDSDKGLRIKAAHEALAKEIFGDMSDCENAAAKDPKSGDSDQFDFELPVSKLCCSKCEFRSNQITEIEIHCLEMHEEQFAHELSNLGISSTKSIPHVQKSHPSISSDCYSDILKCTPEKILENVVSDNSDIGVKDVPPRVSENPNELLPLEIAHEKAIPPNESPTDGADPLQLSVQMDVGQPLVKDSCSPHLVSDGTKLTSQENDSAALDCNAVDLDETAGSKVAMNCSLEHRIIPSCGVVADQPTTTVQREVEMVNENVEMETPACRSGDKYQELMEKTESPSHESVRVREEEVSNTLNDAQVVDQSLAQGLIKGAPAVVDTSSEKSGLSLNDQGNAEASGTTVMQILARDSSKANDLGKFSFLRKKTDLVFANATSSDISTTGKQDHLCEDDPPFESLSDDRPFAAEDTSNDVTSPDVAKGDRSNNGEEDPRVDADVLKSDTDESCYKKNLPSTGSDVDTANFPNAAQYSTEEVSQLLAVPAVPTREESVAEELTDRLPVETGSALEGTSIEPPVIDISEEHESLSFASKTLIAPSLSWTEPIGSEDEDDNYFISPKHSKPPAADFTSQPNQEITPVEPSDLTGDYATEVVFDNGMTALVLEVDNSSDEEL